MLQVYSYPSSSGYSSLSPRKLPLTDNSSLNTPPASIDTGLITGTMPYSQSHYRIGPDSQSYHRAGPDSQSHCRAGPDTQSHYRSGPDSQSHHRTGSAHYPISSSPIRKGFSPSK